MNTPIRALVIALALAGLGACKTKEVREIPPVTPDSRDTSSVTPGDTEGGIDFSDPTSLDSVPCLVSRLAYFDLDQASIKSEAMEMIRCHGKYLAANPGARVSLEGHADERGSREYNLGLGERRSNAVRDLLLANGGSSEQINVLSYGEERPICTESDDGCWSQNRRAEIRYTAKQ